MCRNYTNLATFFIIVAFLSLSFSSSAKQRTIKYKKGSIFVVTMATTHGDIVIRLLNETPIHRDNFVKLAHNGFYDNILFHRVINDFMIQAGDPTSRDRSDEARKEYGETSAPYQLKAEIDSSIAHYRGAVGAARESDNNPDKMSSGSQFYIVQCPPTDKMKSRLDGLFKAGKMSQSHVEEYGKRGGTPHLDGGYTVFGRVLDGMDVVDKVAAEKCDSKDCPERDIEIVKTKVKQYRNKKFKKLYE